MRYLFCLEKLLETTKQDFSNLYVNLKEVFKITKLYKTNISSLALKNTHYFKNSQTITNLTFNVFITKLSTLLDKSNPCDYLPIGSIDLIDNFCNNDLFIHSIFELFVLGVLADLQVSPLERLPNTAKGTRVKHKPQARSKPHTSTGFGGRCTKYHFQWWWVKRKLSLKWAQFLWLSDTWTPLRGQSNGIWNHPVRVSVKAEIRTPVGVTHCWCWQAGLQWQTWTCLQHLLLFVKHAAAPCQDPLHLQTPPSLHTSEC